MQALERSDYSQAATHLLVGYGNEILAFLVARTGSMQDASEALWMTHCSEKKPRAFENVFSWSRTVFAASRKQITATTTEHARNSVSVTPA